MKTLCESLLVTSVLGCLAVMNAGAAQTAVALGSDSTFVALAGTTVTVTGGGSITGNIGISPGNAFVAGVPPVIRERNCYMRCGSIAAQAQADSSPLRIMTRQGRQTPAIVSGNIGGQTLTPGLYEIHFVAGGFVRSS